MPSDTRARRRRPTQTLAARNQRTSEAASAEKIDGDPGGQVELAADHEQRDPDRHDPDGRGPVEDRRDRLGLGEERGDDGEEHEDDDGPDQGADLRAEPAALVWTGSSAEPRQRAARRRRAAVRRRAAPAAGGRTRLVGPGPISGCPPAPARARRRRCPRRRRRARVAPAGRRRA